MCPCMISAAGAWRLPSRATTKAWAVPSAAKNAVLAQQMVLLLGSLAHHVVIWARQWLTQAAASSKLRHDGILRMVRDVFHISGFLIFDALGHLVQIVLNRAAPLAPILVESLQVLLTPTHVAVNSGET